MREPGEAGLGACLNHGRGESRSSRKHRAKNGVKNLNGSTSRTWIPRYRSVIISIVLSVLRTCLIHKKMKYPCHSEDGSIGKGTGSVAECLPSVLATPIPLWVPSAAGRGKVSRFFFLELFSCYSFYEHGYFIFIALGVLFI